MGKRNRASLKPNINPYTREEVSLMLRKAIQLIPRLYPLLLCAVRGGLRQGELIALKGHDMDFANRLIHVQRTLSRSQIKLPKNGKTRFVDMSRQLAGVLQELNRKPDDVMFPEFDRNDA
jgi:integrase